MITSIFILLLAFQVKHLIADYYLQFPYMYENKGKTVGWFEPLFDHALTHSILTFIIVGIYTMISRLYLDIPFVLGTELIILFGLPIIDFMTHFAIDRWKATQPGGPDTSSFWTNLGIDQMLHHIVGIFIVWVLVV